MLLDEGPSDDKGHTEEKLPLVSRKKAHFGSSDNVATIPNEDRSDSAFPNSVIAEFSEESIPENVSPNTTAWHENRLVICFSCLVLNRSNCLVSA